MALSDIKKSAFEYSISMITEVRGWDVSVTQSSNGYTINIIRCVEPDLSDKLVHLGTFQSGGCLAGVKAIVMDAIKDAGISAAKVDKMSKDKDFGVIDIADLKKL